MDYPNLGGFAINGVDRRNIILGKNGCGKSHILKAAERPLTELPTVGLVRYISPERAGYAEYAPNIEQNISNNPGWMGDTRRNNQSENFKQQSAVLYRRLETMVLREVEADRTLPGFDGTVDKINTLLDRVRIERSGITFGIVDKATGTPTTAREISSGESELVSLAIEILAFIKECDKTKHNILLVDEPDVHLHPDLQYRLAKFIISETENDWVSVIIATHSTALLSALADDCHAGVAFMRRGDTSLTFVKVTEAYRDILPIFGAHPLSNVFNEAPILLVEGEDDGRVWQQAIRSAKGKLKAYPCAVDGITHLDEYETDANNIIEAIYDDATGYSIRDRDTGPEDIDDVGHIVRMRLSCRAAENLMLADDTIALAGMTWDTLKTSIADWVTANSKHRFYAEVKKFMDDGFVRKSADLKEIRNILVGMMTPKPWEVLVGQAIAHLAVNGGTNGPDSLQDYLGTKVCGKLLSD